MVKVQSKVQVWEVKLSNKRHLFYTVLKPVQLSNNILSMLE